MTIDQNSGQVRRGGKGSGKGAPKGSPHEVLANQLKTAREARGVDLFRVERDTKIRVKYLSAMEDGDFDQLPGDVYARGFLRNYASYLGLDADEVESQWRRGLVAPKPGHRAPVQGVNAPTLGPVVPGTGLRLPESLMATLGSLMGRFGSQATSSPSDVAGGETSSREVGESGASVIDLPEEESVGSATVPIPEAAAGLPVAAAGSPVGPAGPPPAGSTPAGPPPAGPEMRSPQGAGGTPAGFPIGRPSLPKLALPRVSLPPISLATLSRPFGRGRRSGDASEQFRGPEPMSMPGRAFLLQPIHVVVMALLVVVLAVGGFFIIQARNVLDNPDLSVTSPGAGFTQVATSTRTYRLEGTATAKAEIDVSIDQRTPMKTQASDAGAWFYEITLHSGVNQVDVYCVDLRTGHRSSTITRYLSLPAPTASPVPMYVSIDSPYSGESFKSGNVTVYGTTVSVVSVTVTATYVGPAPSNIPTPARATRSAAPTEIPTLMPTATPTPEPTGSPTPTPKPTAAPSGAPEPVTVIPTIDGKYEAPLHLYSGTWRVTAIGNNKEGAATNPVETTVIVTAGSLSVTIQIRGSATDVKIWKDGKVLSGYGGPPYKRVASGKTIRVVADQSVWIFTGVPNRTYVTVNGVDLGPLSSSNSAASWRITAFGLPTPSNDR